MMRRLVASVLAVASLSAPLPAHAAGAVTVELPHNAVPIGLGCTGGGSVIVEGWRGRGDPITEARAAIAAALSGGDRFFVLGSDGTALWMIEVYNGSDACDSIQCTRVVLRELGFDGRRAVHDLVPRDPSLDLQERIDEAEARLRTWATPRKKRLTPAAFEANRRPHPTAGPRSDWALRIHDPAHAKIYLWRMRLRPQNCWCHYDWELTTHVTAKK
jgi:hypothetical protein